MFDLKQSVPAWVAHASRVLVSASRRNELCRGVPFEMEMGEPEKKSAIARTQSPTRETRALP
ncbi:MAG: hypothetical protein DME75_00710 [Verrucomicrobia bacterium]|nr:MAG: hypothetical protein DME75_00710 [Verrucomicrobiota bacterium]